jgi:hypothetical protein
MPVTKIDHTIHATGRRDKAAVRQFMRETSGNDHFCELWLMQSKATLIQQHGS